MDNALITDCARGPFAMPHVMQNVEMPLQKWKIAAIMPMV